MRRLNSRIIVHVSAPTSHHFGAETQAMSEKRSDLDGDSACEDGFAATPDGDHSQG